MKSDEQLHQDVLAELAFDPAVNATGIGVSVRDRVVTLSGHLETYAEKHAAERAVWRVAGVTAVAIDLEVRLPPAMQRGDAELAKAVEHALAWNATLPEGCVKVQVEKGWVTLVGEVDWPFQRSAAERALRELKGVVGISNHVSISEQNRIRSDDLKQRIEEALTRRAIREARHVEFDVEGGTVTLRGTVHSWADREAAEGAVWSAPGVTKVIDELTIDI